MVLAAKAPVALNRNFCNSKLPAIITYACQRCVLGMYANIMNMAHLLSGPPYLEPLAVESPHHLS
jgi:hypothetical protein